MAYLTERKLANTLDLPIALPSTEIKMGDWVVIATVSLMSPARFTYRFMNLNLQSSNFDTTKILPVNLIVPGFGFCYIGLFANYVSGDPGGIPPLDVVESTTFGVASRNISPLVLTQPGTYSWLAVNNIQFNSQNALITQTDSVDFKLSATGQVRIELDLTQ